MKTDAARALTLPAIQPALAPLLVTEAQATALPPLSPRNSVELPVSRAISAQRRCKFEGGEA